MTSDEIGYKLENVKKVNARLDINLMMPLEVLQSWSLYVFDPESKHLLVMDPTTTFYGEEVMRWEVNASNWQIKYHAGAHFNCSSEQSGVYIVHYIREFNGLYLRSILSDERIEYLRKTMAYQLATMKGNAGDLPDFMIQIVI
nr:uncharacterized protein LOC127318694 [Lolium perenne]